MTEPIQVLLGSVYDQNLQPVRRGADLYKKMSSSLHSLVNAAIPLITYILKGAAQAMILRDGDPWDGNPVVWAPYITMLCEGREITSVIGGQKAYGDTDLYFLPIVPGSPGRRVRIAASLELDLFTSTLLHEYTHLATMWCFKNTFPASPGEEEEKLGRIVGKAGPHRGEEWSAWISEICAGYPVGDDPAGALREGLQELIVRWGEYPEGSWNAEMVPYFAEMSYLLFRYDVQIRRRRANNVSITVFGRINEFVFDNFLVPFRKIDAA